MNKQLQAIIQSYLYAAITAVSALWMTGERDWKTLGVGAITAILAPFIQAANPKDQSLGAGSKKPKN